MSCATDPQTQRQRLELALGTLAALVAKDTSYLPFFRRIEDELTSLSASTSALDRALQLAARQRATR